MTQEVQPLTWQKRTNIEEHQQFFSKINEIIANLAPTVDEAEAAIAQATQALADANAAIATANAASAAADAAAQSAQASAATVAGYGTRLSQVENKASVNQANIATLSGQVDQDGQDIAALQNVQADYVKKAGAAQTVTSQIMVPTTATGVRDTQIANGTRIQNDLAAYEPMIRNTGNQTKSGILNFVTSPNLNISNKGFNMISFTSGIAIGEIPAAVERHGLVLNDRNGIMKSRLWFDIEPNNGAYSIILRLDGTVYNPTTEQNEYRTMILGRLDP